MRRMPSLVVKADSEEVVDWVIVCAEIDSSI